MVDGKERGCDKSGLLIYNIDDWMDGHGKQLTETIFGEKAREVRDTSLSLPHGGAGTKVDVKIFTRDKSEELGAEG